MHLDSLTVNTVEIAFDNGDDGDDYITIGLQSQME